jgi:hypothetical protein
MVDDRIVSTCPLERARVSEIANRELDSGGAQARGLDRIANQGTNLTTAMRERARQMSAGEPGRACD